MGTLDDAPEIEPRSRDEWRAWLEENHATSQGVWFVAPRTAREQPVPYGAAVEEALCFGWVDGKAAGIDVRRSKLYYSPRRPGSGWAATNKARVERLIADGRMQPAGLAVIERARKDGTWTILDGPERLEVPDDLAAALDRHPRARRHWDAFPASARKQILTWIATARRAETRATRVEQSAALAERNERANERRRD